MDFWAFLDWVKSVVVALLGTAWDYVSYICGLVATVDWVKIAPAFTPFVALVAVLVAWRQLRLNRLIQRETIAKTLYREYLLLAIKEPTYSSPDVTQFNFQDRTIGQDNATKHAKYKGYEWFVAYMLHACEEILETHQSRLWRPTVKEQIQYHADYICGPFRTDDRRRHYSRRIRKLIDEVYRTFTPRPPAAPAQQGPVAA
jgi:hypothetical protein